jgi:hypothetical protein
MHLSGQEGRFRMALLEDDRNGPERGSRARTALVAGAVGAAFGLLLTGLLPSVSATGAGLITVVCAAIFAWVPGLRVASSPREHGSTQWVGAHTPDEASVPDLRSRRERRPAHP